MTSSEARLIWVTRDPEATAKSPTLRDLIGGPDELPTYAQVQVEVVAQFGVATIPSGARDPLGGGTLDQPLLIWHNQIPPEGRLYAAEPA